MTFQPFLLRKEVIQPLVLERLPCYDFTPVINPTFDCVLLAVRLQASGVTDSRSYLSYTRHEYFRRILCNLIGTWAENGEFPADMVRKVLSVQIVGCNPPT